MPYLLIGGVLLALGYAAKQTGEGIDTAGTGAIKIALAGVAGYYVLKQTKVIK
tara:strand:+ start:1019 stop:1177 length:159 start_codon:yes stop_codon:yes gene_type:complete